MVGPACIFSSLFKSIHSIVLSTLPQISVSIRCVGLIFSSYACDCILERHPSGAFYYKMEAQCYTSRSQLQNKALHLSPQIILLLSFLKVVGFNFKYIQKLYCWLYMLVLQERLHSCEKWLLVSCLSIHMECLHSHQVERSLFHLQGENPGTQMEVMMGPRASCLWKQKCHAPPGYQTSDCPARNLVSRPSNSGSMRKLIAVIFL